MTKSQRSLARHALGLPNKSRQSYRNRFLVPAGSWDHDVWTSMVLCGYATKVRPETIGDWFALTLDGANAALNSRERLDPEDFPQIAKVTA